MENNGSVLSLFLLTCFFLYLKASQRASSPKGYSYLCLCCHGKVMFLESINKHCQGTMLDARDATENSIFVLFPELVCLDT